MLVGNQSVTVKMIPKRFGGASMIERPGRIASGLTLSRPLDQLDVQEGGRVQ